MIVKINGKVEEFDADRINLLEYLLEKGVKPEMVAVEINLNIVDKSKLKDTYIKHDDVVEIVKFVCGGQW